MTDTTSVYADRIATAAAAVELVKPGEHVFLGTGCATPLALVAALEARRRLTAVLCCIIICNVRCIQ
jgi:DeoR/GlpR family transcriptional regulator of sugar metabolism